MGAHASPSAETAAAPETLDYLNVVREQEDGVHALEHTSSPTTPPEDDKLGLKAASEEQVQPAAAANKVDGANYAYDELNGTDAVEYSASGEPIIRNGSDVSRFIVSQRDDGDPALTFRGLVLGSIFTALSSAITIIYTFKPASEQVSALFLMLVVWVFGKAWELFTPSPSRFSSPLLRRVLSFLNSGQPFLLKEHVVASLIASSANNGLAGVEIYAIEKLYYNRAIQPATAILGTFSISLCGFILAGVLRPLIIYPAEMVYWTTLPQVVLFQNLHHDIENNRRRVRKFGAWFGGAAIWEVFPAYIAPWLNGLSVFCLASMGATDHIRTIFTNLFGGASANEGLGILNITLDWQYITSFYLAAPLKQQLNTWIGYIIFYIGMASLYYGNAWDAKTFPFMSSSLFTAEGKRYPQTDLLNEFDEVDPAKLEQYGRPHLTATTVWGYTCTNVAIGAMITHVLIWYSKSIWQTIKRSREGAIADVHYQAMRRYAEVPMWWYLVLFLLAFVAGIIANVKGNTTLSVGYYIVALLLGAVIAPFSCILYGLYGTGISTNAISKMVGGAVQPNKPIANLYFAAWSHQVILLAVNLSNWLKVGQYTKVPHRIMFFTQVYASLLGAALNYVVMNAIVTNKREILLDPRGDATWSGQTIGSLNSQAITWALAKEVYSSSSQYFIVPLGIIIGLFLPAIHYGLIRLFPRAGIQNWQLATPFIALAAGSNYVGNTSPMTSTILVGILSQVYLRRYKARWYNKYNYLVGAALDGGSQTVILILSFAVFGAGGKAYPFPTWFGNPAGNPDHCLDPSS